MELWFGGRPLMSHPEHPERAALESHLREACFELGDASEDGMSVRRPLPGPSPLAAWLLLQGFFVPLTTVLLWSHPRRARHARRAARGVPVTMCW